MSSSRERVKHWLFLLALAWLLVLTIAAPPASHGQGPEHAATALRHGPAVDSGDPALPDVDRSEEQREFARLARAPSRAAGPPGQVIRVYVLDFNPTIDGVPLVEYKNWNDPAALMQVYGDDVQAASWNITGFEIVKHTVVDGYPLKPGGFVFTNALYLGCLIDASPEYCMRIIDYQAVLNTKYDDTYSSACAALAGGSVDEIWLWGGPFFGYWEYLLVDPWSLCWQVDAGFAVMGYSYERTDAEMLHDLGHRSEDVLQNRMGLELWDRFDGQRWRYEQKVGCPPQPDDRHPEVDANHAHAGNVHFPPNAYCHYQYTRAFPVLSDAEDWLDYPHLAGEQTTIDSPTWGASQRGFLLWWFQHFPHAGVNVDSNWWLPLFERATLPYHENYFPAVAH